MRISPFIGIMREGNTGTSNNCVVRGARWKSVNYQQIHVKKNWDLTKLDVTSSGR